MPAMIDPASDCPDPAPRAVAVPLPPAAPLRAARLALMVAALLASVIAAAIATGCRSVPMTGRKQLLVGSEAKEIEMGKQAYAELMASETPSTNAAAAALVQRVGDRIAAASGRTDYEWEFRLIAGETPNAFCLPGGKVAVYEGILPVCQSEAGLAGVMSHEVAHALARHGGERMNQQMVVNGLGAGVNILTGQMDEKKKQMIAGAYGAASKYGVVLPYSRKHESEADAIGLTLMAQAGYDPSEASEFWTRFGASAGPKPPEFLSTHPADAKRAAALRTQLPEAMAVYNAAAVQYGQGDAVPGVAIQTVSYEEPAE